MVENLPNFEDGNRYPDPGHRGTETRQTQLDYTKAYHN